MAKEKINVWKCECDKCGHIWVSKNQIVPAMCAKCRTVTWDRGKVLSDAFSDEITEKEVKGSVEHIKSLGYAKTEEMNNFGYAETKAVKADDTKIKGELETVPFEDIP